MSLKLSEYLDFICPKVGQSDTISRNLCRTFVQHRYRMIYDMRNWKDALDLITGLEVGLDGIMPYPDGIDRIIAIRSSGNHMIQPTDSAFIMEQDPTLFERSGDPLAWEDYYVPSVAVLPAPGIHKIRVFPVPTIATNIILQGKRTFTQLTNDSDAPILRNIDQALIAYGTADMLQRQRQYQKAQTVYQEASAALDNMVKAETERSGFNVQIIPIPESYEDEGDSFMDRLTTGTVTVPTDTENGITNIPQFPAVTVVFANAKTSANWRFTTLVVAYTGTPPTNIFVTTMTSKLTTGFTVSLNATPPNLNYRLEWGVTLP
jgi:hypothetical protein